MHRSCQKTSIASWAADVSRFGGEIAGGTLSHARVACEGPRATFQATFFGAVQELVLFSVGRGPVPRHA